MRLLILLLSLLLAAWPVAAKTPSSWVSSGGGGSLTGVTCDGVGCTFANDVTITGALSQADQGVDANVIDNYCNGSPGSVALPAVGSAGWFCSTDPDPMEAGLYSVTQNASGDRLVSRMGGVECLIPVYALHNGATPAVNFQLGWAGTFDVATGSSFNTSSQARGLFLPPLVADDWSDYEVLGFRGRVLRGASATATEGGWDAGDSYTVTLRAANSLTTGDAAFLRAGTDITGANVTITQAMIAANPGPSYVHEILFPSPVALSGGALMAIITAKVDTGTLLKDTALTGCWYGTMVRP